MTEVNLLPPELRRRQRSRQLSATVLLAAGAIVVLLFVVFLFESAKLSSSSNDLEAQDARNVQLQRQIAGLERFDQLKQAVDERQTLVETLVQDEVKWSGVLHDLSMVIPGQVYVTQFSGTISSDPSSTETAVTPEGLIGTLQFQGVALDHSDVALWLDRLVEVHGWVNAWVSTETEVGAGASAGMGVQFTGTVDLSKDAATSGSVPPS